MPYPWPSFGDFIFGPTERALDGLGGVWNYNSSESRSRAAGALTDNVVLVAIGSGQREFGCYLSPARLDVLRTHLYQSETFTDWQRPTPDSRGCRLDSIEAGDSVAFMCDDGSTDRRILTTVKLTTQ